MKLREPTSPGSSSVGQTFLHVKVQGIDDVNGNAIVVDQLGYVRQVSTRRMFSKNAMLPSAGDNWIITRMFGDWMFAVFIDLPGTEAVF